MTTRTTGLAEQPATVFNLRLALRSATSVMRPTACAQPWRIALCAHYPGAYFSGRKAALSVCDSRRASWGGSKLAAAKRGSKEGRQGGRITFVCKLPPVQKNVLPACDGMQTISGLHFLYTFAVALSILTVQSYGCVTGNFATGD